TRQIEHSRRFIILLVPRVSWRRERSWRPLSISWRIQRLIIILARSMLLVEPLIRESIRVVFAVLVLDRHHHRYDSSW
ncbi:hypothetical protein LINPERPRIM_LOCUS20741, partial [Linum perenne]